MGVVRLRALPPREATTCSEYKPIRRRIVSLVHPDFRCGDAASEGRLVDRCRINDDIYIATHIKDVPTPDRTSL